MSGPHSQGCSTCWHESANPGPRAQSWDTPVPSGAQSAGYAHDLDFPAPMAPGNLWLGPGVPLVVGLVTSAPFLSRPKSRLRMISWMILKRKRALRTHSRKLFPGIHITKQRLQNCSPSSPGPLLPGLGRSELNNFYKPVWTAPRTLGHQAGAPRATSVPCAFGESTRLSWERGTRPFGLCHLQAFRHTRRRETDGVTLPPLTSCSHLAL